MFPAGPGSYVLTFPTLCLTPERWMGSAGGRGASVTACADLTNQLQCCWVDPACAWKKHWHSNCRLPVNGGGGDTTPCTVDWCKKVRGAWLASSYCMGFQNFVVSNKIHPYKQKYEFSQPLVASLSCVFSVFRGAGCCGVAKTIYKQFCFHNLGRSCWF